MERKFKFEVGQYVKIVEEVLKINNGLPNYPCEITYRFFDGKEISYIICDTDKNERPFLERDLVLYANDSNNYDTIQEMQKEILDLQKRITDLEFEVSKIKCTSKRSVGEVKSGSERRCEEDEESRICLPEE